MKFYLYLLAFVFSLASVETMAQPCQPNPNQTTPGFSPPSSQIPCAIIDSAFTQSVSFKNFTTFNGITVQYLRVDSITNLPAGITYQFDRANPTYQTGEQGCILLSGTPSGDCGQYKLNVYVSIRVSILPSEVSGEADALAANFGIPPIRNYIRLKACPGANCVPVDTTQSVPFVPYATCLPATPVIAPAGPVNLCQGSSTSLRITGNYTAYQWLNNGVSISGTNSPVYQTDSSGVYSVRATLGGCSATSAPVTVNVTNAQIRFNLLANRAPELCTGERVTLYTPAGYTSINWYQNGALLSSQTDSFYTTGVEGYYHVTANQGNCTAISDSVFVDTLVTLHNLAITPSTSGPVCGNDTVLLQATPGFAGYNWTKNGQPFGITFVNELEVIGGGVYQVASSDMGCPDTSSVVSITTSPTPDAQIQQSGTPPVLTATPAGGTYRWFRDDILIPSATAQTFQPGVTGVYSVEVTLNNCSDRSPNLSITISGIGETEALKLNIYPNPAQQGMWVELPESDVALTILDVQGKVCHQTINLSAGKQWITLQDLPNGVYVVAVKTSKGIYRALMAKE